MKSNLKLIIITVVLLVVVLGAGALYDNLSKDISIDMPTKTTSQNNTHSPEKEENTDYTAPNFTVLDYNGEEVQLSDFKGKPVVINFWATWCYYCKEEMPDFNKAFKNYPDVQFVMVNATDGYQETVATAKKYVEDEGFDFNVYFDTKGEAVNAYYVNSFPTTYFIEENGDLVTYANGMLDYQSLENGIKMIIE